MAITFGCPDCQQMISVPDEYAGKQGRCPGCEGVLTIPAGDAAPPAAPGPALTPGASETKQCPSCAETIKAVARKCRFCGEFLDRPPGGRGRGRGPRRPGSRGAAPARRGSRSARGVEPGSWGLGFLAGFLGGCIGLILVMCLAKGEATKQGAGIGFVCSIVASFGIRACAMAASQV